MTMTKVGRGRVACKPDTNINKSSIKSERQFNFKVIQSYVKITASFRYGSDYSPRSGANSYKFAGNDDVFSLFHAETD